MHVQTTKYAEDRVKVVGPHALLGEMLANMSAIEAHLLVMTSASHLPSTVAQNILRDVMVRCRNKAAGS